MTPAIFASFSSISGVRGAKSHVFVERMQYQNFFSPIFVKTTCFRQGTKRPFSKMTVSTTLNDPIKFRHNSDLSAPNRRPQIAAFPICRFSSQVFFPNSTVNERLIRIARIEFAIPILSSQRFRPLCFVNNSRKSIRNKNQTELSKLFMRSSDRNEARMRQDLVKRQC